MILSAILIIIYFASTTKAFCNMNEASEIQKYMMLHSKPTTQILINNMINEYSKRTGVPMTDIKNCVEAKKKAMNNKTIMPNLRGNQKKVSLK